MLSDKEKQNLIGCEVGVLDALGNEFKKIIIKDIKSVGDEDIFFDEDGIAYNDSQINWSYKLSLGATCMVWLVKCGYADNDIFSNDVDKYENQIKILMDSLVNGGFLSIEDSDDDDNTEYVLTPSDILAKWLYKFDYINEKDLNNDFSDDYKNLINIMINQGYITKE